MWLADKKLKIEFDQKNVVKKPNQIVILEGAGAPPKITKNL